MRTTDDLLDRLSEPFDPAEVAFKPAAVSGNRALAICFVTARTVQDRLDAAVGPANWQVAYDLLPNGCVVCRLSLRIDGEWITKADVGAPSEQDDDGDKTKAAFSDALKRAAVQWSIGRYLYALPKAWVDYDVKSRQMTPPQLPPHALPWVTPRQAEELLALVEQAHVDLDKFLAHYGIGRVEHLPAVKYPEAAGKLQARRAGNGTAGVKAAAGKA
jgi:hypothetical protein